MADVFSEIERIHKEMDRIFSDSLKSTKRLLSKDFHVPLIDVKETKKDIVVKVDLPGVDKKDINLTVTDHYVEVKAEKSSEKKEEKKGFHKKERSHLGYYRSFTLPGYVDSSKTKAEFKNGTLTISIPKAKELTGGSRKIQIK